MKHRFLLTLDSAHDGGYLTNMLRARILPGLQDLNNVTFDIAHDTKWLPPAMPEEVRKLARQIMLYTGVRPAMITITDNHFKAHDEGGEMITSEWSDSQRQHLSSLFGAAHAATKPFGIPYTFHLKQVLSEDDRLALSRLQDSLEVLGTSGILLMHDGTFDTANTLLKQVNDILKRSGS